MFLINGERRQCIDVADRGFQYGDGLFETLEVLNGQPLFLDRHLLRLQSGCGRLLIPSPDLSFLTIEAYTLCADVEHAVLKLIVTRGGGGRGYRQPAEISPSRVFGLHPYPQYPDSYQQNGVAVRFCRQTLSANPALAGIKHLNRLEQILARAEWQDDAIQEGLMLDTAGHVIEGTMSNLFAVKRGTLYTPTLSEAGVAGIVRQIVLDIAAQQQIPVVETALSVAALFAADELFLTNSVIGIWPVSRLEQQSYGSGALTRTLQKMYAAMRDGEQKND